MPSKTVTAHVEGLNVRGTKGHNDSDGPRRGRWSEAERARLQELYGLRDDVAIGRELNRPVASVRKMAEKLFPPIVDDRPWTDQDVEQLKRYLGASPVPVIARVVRRSVQDVNAKIRELDDAKAPRPWTREEVAEFKRIYGTRTDEDLVRIFGRPIEAVQELALRFALAKDKAFLRRLQGNSATRMPRWSADEVETLTRLYPLVPNVQLAKELGRSLKSVVSKAHNLGLKKSPDRLRAMGRENVSLRYHPEKVGHERDFSDLPPVEDVHEAGQETDHGTLIPARSPEVEPAPAEPVAEGERTVEIQPATPQSTEESQPTQGTGPAAMEEGSDSKV